MKEAGRSISPSALSKIENGDRRVDVDDLTALAYALGITPYELLSPPGDGSAPTGVPDSYVPEELTAWMRGTTALMTTALVRYWTEEARHCQSYIKRFTDLLALMGDEERGITPRAVYEDRLKTQQDRLASIRGRLLELDPNGVPIDG
jgi:transcriptional regulator with XRE-family HTH domain